MKLIGAYLWAWRNYEAGEKSLSIFKKNYPDADLFINVDYTGDLDNYKIVASKLNATLSKHPFQVGYCGNFNDKQVGYECWSREAAFQWVNSFYGACKKSDVKYMVILEEDDFILKPVSILNKEFAIAVRPTFPSAAKIYRPNEIPEIFIKECIAFGGSGDVMWYGAGGGVILNRELFIASWDKCKDYLWEKYDYFKKNSILIGWEDFLIQYIMMLGGYSPIENQGLCEFWELPNAWFNYEIVTVLKDHNLIDMYEAGSLETKNQKKLILENSSIMKSIFTGKISID